MVWDPAAGTGNLTRDHTFHQLLCSTLEKDDLARLSEQEGEMFRYDFLNPEPTAFFFEDPDENLAPPEVTTALKRGAAEKKKLLWLMNPPYGTANNREKGVPKTGVANTQVNQSMKSAGLGPSATQLYAQFMFQAEKMSRAFGFEETVVALFSRPSFITSSSFRAFRDWWYPRYGYLGGFLFRASHFTGVGGRWGVSFTLWQSPGYTKDPDLMVTVKDVVGGVVVGVGEKMLYHGDDRSASHWVRAYTGETKLAPLLSSGLKIQGSGSLPIDAFGVLASVTNSQITSTEGVFLLSSCARNGIPITEENLRKVIAFYTARKTQPRNWVNATDEYLIPDTEIPGYDQWVDAGHVFTLADGVYNNCTALRDTWILHNQFFWKTAASARKNLSDAPLILEDCQRNSFDPVMAGKLQSLNLSPEAEQVMWLLDNLWVKSLGEREQFAQNHPELHLMAWDAGVYQLKHLWKDLFPTEWVELQTALKVLSNKLRPGVYTYGFLRK